MNVLAQLLIAFWIINQNISVIAVFNWLLYQLVDNDATEFME